MGEIFMRSLPGYEGLYSVTSDGRLFNHKTKRFLFGQCEQIYWICTRHSQEFGSWAEGPLHAPTGGDCLCPGGFAESVGESH